MPSKVGATLVLTALHAEIGGNHVEKRLLFVCAANVCRSPLMQFEFSGLVAADGGSGEWRLQSAGAHVAGSLPVCSVVDEILVRDGVAHDDVAAHRSRQIDADLIEDADLVITASLAERAVVARLVPTARERTFTLREANVLSADVTGAASLDELAVELNKRRAYGLLPTARTGWSFGRPHPLDIPDDHGSRAPKHAGTLSAARAYIRTFHTQLSRALAEA